jgi:hypothetical protein
MKEKIIFWLVLDCEGGFYCAVVIESSGREAQDRACLMDKHRRDWRKATVSPQARVGTCRTPIVLAMDGVE